jgi:hypothetical protein
MNADGKERLTLNVRSERFAGGPLRANALDPSCWEKRRATKGCAARMDARKQDVTPLAQDVTPLAHRGDSPGVDSAPHRALFSHPEVVPFCAPALVPFCMRVTRGE